MPEPGNTDGKKTPEKYSSRHDRGSVFPLQGDTVSNRQENVIRKESALQCFFASGNNTVREGECSLLHQ